MVSFAQFHSVSSESAASVLVSTEQTQFQYTRIHILLDFEPLDVLFFKSKMATSPNSNSPPNDGGEEISLGKYFRHTITSFCRQAKEGRTSSNPFLSKVYLRLCNSV